MVSRMTAGDLKTNSRPNVPRVYIRKPSSAVDLNSSQEQALVFNYPPSSVRRKKHLSPVRAIDDRRTSTTSPHGFLRHPLARKNSVSTRRLPPAPPAPPKLPTRRTTLSKRLEIALDKFTHVALPFHLNHIYKHKKSIERLQHLGEWEEVSREVHRATKSVHQLGVLLFEIEILRTYVEESDLPYFDERVNPAKTSALVAVHGLQEMCPVSLMSNSTLEREDSTSRCDEKGAASSNAITYCSNPLYNDSSSGDFDYGNRSLTSGSRAPTTGTLEVLYEDPKEDSVSLISTLDDDEEEDETSHLIASNKSFKTKAGKGGGDSKARDLECRKETLKAWNLLHEEIKDLQELISEFSPVVSKEHRGKKVTTSSQRTSHLSSTAIYPVAGALLGTCLGGPVGFLAGVKIGGLAAIGGSVFGYSTGIVIKEQIDRQDYIDDFYAHRSRSQVLRTPPSISTASSSQILADSASQGRRKAPPLRDRTQSLPDVYTNKGRGNNYNNSGNGCGSSVELSRSRSVRTRHIPPTKPGRMMILRCNSSESTTTTSNAALYSHHHHHSPQTR